MRKPSKKPITVIATICIAVMIFVALPWIIFSYRNMWRFSADFADFESDFCLVRDYMQKELATESSRWVSVSRTGIYDPENAEYVEISDDVRISLERICNDGFPDEDATLDFIRIQGNRISFHIENGRYALVYSPDEKPTWLNSPDEQCEIKVKKINSEWYHVIVNPG